MAAHTRISRTIPKLCRHKATGLAVVRLQGQDIYCGKFGSADAKAKYDTLILEWLQRGRILPPSIARDQQAIAAQEPGKGFHGLSIAELVLAYNIHTDEYYKNSSSEREKVKLSVRPLRDLYGLTPAAAFGPLALKAVRDRLLQPTNRIVPIRDATGHKTGERTVEYVLSRRTVNQRIDIVKRLFAWAAESEHVPPSVWHGLLAVKGLRKGRSTAKEPRVVKPVSDTAVEAVLERVSAPVRALIQIQRWTGARSGELCIMRPCDVDTIPAIWVYRPGRHKNDYREGAAAREILIGPKAQKILGPYLDRDREAFVFSSRDAREERYRKLRTHRKTRVQSSQLNRRKRHPKRSPGERFNVKSYYHAVRAACRRAEIPPWHPHQLRHTAATVIRREFGIETARILLGHATAFTTELYAERDRGLATEAIAKVG